MKKLPKSFFEKLRTQENANFEKDEITPFQFSEDVLNGKRRIVAGLPKHKKIKRDIYNILKYQNAKNELNEIELSTAIYNYLDNYLQNIIGYRTKTFLTSEQSDLFINSNQPIFLINFINCISSQDYNGAYRELNDIIRNCGKGEYISFNEMILFIELYKYLITIEQNYKLDTLPKHEN